MSTPPKFTPRQLEILNFVLEHPGCTREQINWHLVQQVVKRWNILADIAGDRHPAPWLWPDSRQHP